MEPPEDPATAGEVARANVALHSRLAARYDVDEPHFRPENRARVGELLRDLAGRSGGGRLLDLGCGTGFVLGLAAPHFERVVGVDLTPAMLERIDRSNPGVRAVRGDTSRLPWGDATFDVVTAYSFLHHLHDLEATLREAARVLRPGGIFFSELDPNYYFWEAMKGIEPGPEVPPIVAREVHAVRDKDQELAEQSGLPPETVRLAEYLKAVAGGLEETSVLAAFGRSGFVDVRFGYHWFLGQGAVHHQRSPELARSIDEHLRACLPVSRSLYKYVTIEAVTPGP